MSFNDLKITSYQDSVSALPDYPSDAGITAAQLKEVFDGRTDKEIKQKFNALIDEIVAKFDDVTLEIFNEIMAHNGDDVAHGELFASKVDKVVGKVLSSNDFTDEDKLAISEAYGEALNAYTEAVTHANDYGNPHNVTAEQIGLGRADNTPDSDKSVAYALKAELDLLGNVIHEHYATKDDVGDVDLSGYVTWEDFENRTTPIENNVADIIEGLGDIDTALDAILAIQGTIVGGGN